MLDEARMARIEATIQAQEAQGRDWTNQSIYDVVGGNYASLSQYLKARRAQGRGPGRGGGAQAALAEETTRAEEPTTLQEELQAAQDAEQYAEMRLSLLEEKATRELLSTEEEIEVLRLERRLGTLASVLTRLHREIEQAKEVVDIEAFVQAWLPTVEAKRQRYQEFFEAVAHVFHTFEAIGRQHDAQVEGLMTLPPKLQRYMHQTFLPDRATIGARLVGSMVNPGAWQGILLGMGGLQLPVLETLMSNDPGCFPLPPRLMQNAINASQPVDRGA